MEKDLVDIVMEKSYIELSASEKAELSEFCGSESEFNQLKEVFLGAEMMQFETFVPKKETKESLDGLFDSTYPKVTPVWYMSVLAVIVPKEKSIHRQPLLQIAAVGLLIFLAFPFLQNDMKESTPQMAELGSKKSVQKMENEITKSSEKSDLIDEPVDVATVVLGETIETPIVLAEVGTRALSLDLNHPDGVWDETTDVAFSQPASAEPEMLDLLTATF